MNLAEMRVSIERRTGTSHDALALNSNINEAVQVIATERVWPWLDATDTFETVADTASYALPLNWSSTRSATIEGSKMRALSMTDGDSFQHYDDTTTIYSYVVEGDSDIGPALTLFPTPQQILTVVHRYLATEPVLTLDTDTPILPAPYHVLICDYAAMIVTERMGNKRSADFESRYRAGLKRAIAQPDKYTAPRRVRVRPGSML